MCSNRKLTEVKWTPAKSNRRKTEQEKAMGSTENRNKETDLKGK